MTTITRHVMVSAVFLGLVFAASSAQSAPPTPSSVAQRWIDGWNASNPDSLAAAFTSDGVYQDVPSNLHCKGNTGLRELHKFFHEAVGGLYVKLFAAHIGDGHGTIEWIFGGTDLGLYRTGKPFAVPGVSVIDVKKGVSPVIWTITPRLRS
jgi:hypothetical protein